MKCYYQHTKKCPFFEEKTLDERDGIYKETPFMPLTLAPICDNCIKKDMVSALELLRVTK